MAIEAFYVDCKITYGDIPNMMCISVIRLPEWKAQRKADLLDQLFLEQTSKSQESREIERRFEKIQGPQERYLVPVGQYTLGQVLDKLPINAIPIPPSPEWN